MLDEAGYFLLVCMVFKVERVANIHNFCVRWVCFQESLGLISSGVHTIVFDLVQDVTNDIIRQETTIS